jgi:hypothetical protein
LNLKKKKKKKNNKQNVSMKKKRKCLMPITNTVSLPILACFFSLKIRGKQEEATSI